MNPIAHRKPTDLAFHDQFCGAGGNAEAARALGLRGVVALNHWPLAIETHNTNHPEIDHDCTDVSTCDPQRYAPANILISSPECTNHSLAKGRKRNLRREQRDLFSSKPPDPAEDRSRATMGDVVRFTSAHRYELVIVENVVDVKRWWLYNDWLREMHSLGYLHREVFLNAMFAHPTPQSRDRIYVVFWKKGNPAPDLDFCPPAFCAPCSADVEAVQAWRDTPLGRQRWGRYQQQYDYICPRCAARVAPYRFAALNCIDWSIPAQKIGDRRRPLADRTMARVRYGLEKFGNQALVITGRYTSGLDCRVRAAALDVLPTQPADLSHALLAPSPAFVVQTSFSHAPASRAYDGLAALSTQTAQQSFALVGLPFLSLQYTTEAAKGMLDPSATVTTSDHHALVAPPGFVISMNQFGDKKGVSATGEPLPTVTTAPARFALAQVPGPPPFLASLFGTSKVNGATDPLGCVTAGGINHALLSTEAVRAFLCHHYSGGGQVTSLADALWTVTTIDRAALVALEQGAAPPLDPDECTFRMLKPPEILRAQALDVFRGHYTVLGNQREQVKQIGQANPPPTLHALLERGLQTFA